MRTPNERETPVTGYVWPGVAVFVAALYTYYTSQSELESARPQEAGLELLEPVGPKYFEKVRARVWEDPFERTRDSLTEQVGEERPEESAACEGLDAETIRSLREHFQRMVDRGRNKSRKTLLLPVLVNGGPYAAEREQRIRVRYAISTALAASGMRLRYPDRVSYVVPRIRVDVGGQKKDVREGEKEKETEREHGVGDVEIAIPFKLYSRDEVNAHEFELAGHDAEGATYESVLVLWIDESRLGTSPLYGLANVLATLFGPDTFSVATKSDEKPNEEQEPETRLAEHVDLRIIGPSNSKMLLAMAMEDEPERATTVLTKLCNEPPELDERAATMSEVYRKATMYSARATVSESALREREAGRLRSFVDPDKDRTRGPRVVRVVGDDLHLVRAIRKELTLRGAWPSADNRDQTVVLVTEQDTLYGRGIASLFHSELADSLGVTPDRLPPAFSREFFYLQGIDGQVPSGTSPKEKSRDRESSGGGDEDVPQYVEPRPESRSQYDYMHRLRQNLEDYNREVKRQGYTGITCIGVVGRDVYDELLVMRALRAGFPEATFFTLDLDAQLTHEDEIDQTRNTIVASHFGLRLSENLQRGVGEFRDSYQTSTYLACLLAVEDPRTRNVFDRFPGLAQQPWRFDRPNAGLRPLVFEIGRKRAYQLTRVGASSSSSGFEAVESNGRSFQGVLPSGVVQPASPREVAWVYWPYLLVSLALAVALVAVLRKLFPALRGSLDRVGQFLVEWPDNRMKGVVWGLLLVFVAFLLSLVVDQYRADGEPFTLSGISLWPTSFIRLLIPGVAAVFVFRVQRDLNKSSDEVKNRRRAVRDRDTRDHDPLVSGIDVYDIRERWYWSLLAAFLWFLVVYVVSWMTDSPRLPSRGWLSWAWGHPLRWLADVAALFVFLTYFDVSEKARACVRRLVNDEAVPDDPDARTLASIDEDEAADTVHVIGVYTNAVAKLLVWAVVSLLLLLAGATPVLDFAPVSGWYIVLLGTAFALVVIAVVALRGSAFSAREKLIGEFAYRREQAVLAQGTKKVDENKVKRFDYVLDTLRSENHGAFRPWSTSPLVQYLLFGGAGSVILIQTIARWL